MGKFEIHKTSAGYHFNIKASNGEAFVTSEVYTSEASYLNGIQSVKDNAATAQVVKK